MFRRRAQLPVQLISAVFSRHPAARAWVREQLQGLYGPVALVSEPFPFQHTHYYETTMGPGLCKEFLVFRELVSEDALPPIKRQCIALETELARSGSFPEARPVNIDPGLLTLGKFLLATTKDQAHRIYLRDGIYAEVTLRYQAHHFEAWPWTYADYREPALHEFLQQARRYYRARLEELAEAPGPESSPHPPG